MKNKSAQIGNKTHKKRPTHAPRYYAALVTSETRFDCNSFPIVIDSHTTICVPNDITHFISLIIPANKATCKGFVGNTTPISGMGIIRWR